MPADMPADILSHGLLRERRAVPLWWWVVAIGLAVPSVEIVVVFAPNMTSRAGWPVALAAAVVTTAVVAAGLWALSRSVICVDAAGLHCGTATLPASAVGAATPLDAAAAREILGPKARADAHLDTRPWIRTAVRVENADPADATPYWLVSTRRPQKLARALDQIRTTVAAARPAGDDGDVG